MKQALCVSNRIKNYSNHSALLHPVTNFADVSILWKTVFCMPLLGSDYFSL